MTALKVHQIGVSCPCW